MPHLVKRAMVSKYLILCTTSLLLLGACDVPDWLGDDEAEAILPGDRVSILDFDSSINPDLDIVDDPVIIPAVQINRDMAYETDAQSQGYENLSVTGLNKSDSIIIGDGEEWETILVTPPVIANGVLFAMDASGVVGAYDTKDLDREIWVSDYATLEDEDDIGGGGLAYSKGVLYMTTGYGAILAFVAEDGSLLWRRDVDIPMRAAPVVKEGKLFTITIDNQLLAYDAHTGKPLWGHRGIKENAVYLGAVSPAIENGIVVAAHTSGEIYAVRAEDGSTLWSDSLILLKRTSAAAGLTGIDATPLIKDGVVYAVSNNGLFVANALANGRGFWDKELSGYNTPWIAGDYLFMLSSDNALVAIRRKDGAVKWITSLKQTEGDRDVTPRLSGPIMVNGELLVVTDNGEMIAFNPQDGKVARRYDIPDDVRTAPIVADGTLYLLSADARITSYR